MFNVIPVRFSSPNSLAWLAEMENLLCSQVRKYRSAVFTKTDTEIYQASLRGTFNYDCLQASTLCLYNTYVCARVRACVRVFVLRLCCSMAPSLKRTRTDLWASETTGLTLNSSWYSAPSLLTQENNTCSPLCVKCQCQPFCCDEVCSHHSSREWLP